MGNRGKREEWRPKRWGTRSGIRKRRIRGKSSIQTDTSHFESGSERTPRGLPRGKRANEDLVSSLGIGDPPVFPEDQSNPAAGAFPAAFRDGCERMMFKISPLGIEDSSELAPEGFNRGMQNTPAAARGPRGLAD